MKRLGGEEAEASEAEQENSAEITKDGANLMKTRMILDQQYVQSWHEGRRIRKKATHMKLLLEYFN